MSYTALLTDTITYWSTPVQSTYGEFSFAAPTTISCRYQNHTENLIDDAGHQFVSRAVVYTTSQLELNSWIYLGTSIVTNPQNVTNAFRVRKLYTTQTPNDSITVYKAFLG